MNTATEHIYLCFDINNHGSKIGEVKILIHKKTDIEKWKNPSMLEQEAIDLFKTENPDYKNIQLNAFFTGDLVPFV